MNRSVHVADTRWGGGCRAPWTCSSPGALLVASTSQPPQRRWSYGRDRGCMVLGMRSAHASGMCSNKCCSWYHCPTAMESGAHSGGFPLLYAVEPVVPTPTNPIGLPVSLSCLAFFCRIPSLCRLVCLFIALYVTRTPACVFLTLAYAPLGYCPSVRFRSVTVHHGAT